MNIVKGVLTVSLIILKNAEANHTCTNLPWSFQEEDQCTCLRYSPDMRTVLVKYTMGNLGNKMMTYVIAQLMKVLYEVDIFVTRPMIEVLRNYFEDVDQLPIAEEKLCGFEKFFKEFRNHQFNKIRNVVKEEMGKRKNDTTDMFEVDSSDGLVNVLHSNKVYHLEVGLDDPTKQLSSFPWQEFSRDAEDLLSEEERRGKAFVFYPSGFLFSAFDKRINTSYTFDQVPGMLDFALKAFTFKEYFRIRAQETLE